MNQTATISTVRLGATDESGQQPAIALNRGRSRHAADRRLRLAGLAAVGLALWFLVLLFSSLVVTGYSAFTQVTVRIEADLSSLAGKREQEIRDANWRAILRDELRGLAPDLPKRDERAFFALFTPSAHYLLRDAVLADPSMLRDGATFHIPLADTADRFAKGEIERSLPEDQRRLTDVQISHLDRLETAGRLERSFNTGLFLNSDSRFPELAGLKGAIVGSFWLLAVCFALSFPIGVAAAVWLEEFAPRSRFATLVEININNLAAVPSVVFGLLGLAVLLGVFGLPRSTPLAGGIVLALMTMPTIIIVSRAALKQVPAAIMEGALALGATKHQAILHHKLPLAMPSILTGAIIGLAQALGETAPLLLIGMNAFIAGDPGGLLDPATALPTQIYIWADSPERGFLARTAAAILVLIGFLVLMNGLAVFLRQRLAKRW